MKSLEQVFASLTSQESFFQERLDYANEKAKKIINNEMTTEQDLIDRMKYLISSHFSIPYHSSFFDELTVDDLLLEVMLISEGKKAPETRAGEIIKGNQVEAEDAFADLMDEEDFDVPDEFSEEEQEFINKQGKSFKQDGLAGLKNKA
jgi:hypothetical protein